MADLKDTIMDCMYDSMDLYVNSSSYRSEQNMILKHITELREMLDPEGCRKLNNILDLINDSDRRYAEEASFRGFIDSVTTK